MTSLEDFARIADADHGLCVVSTLRENTTIQASVVSAGVLEHPVGGRPVVAFVAGSRSRKLRNLRYRPQLTVVVRAGFQWQAIEGTAELAGPDDDLVGIDGEAMTLLLRQVFTAAGGLHDDWETYDRVMAEERRTAVLVTPTRLYSNG